LPVEEEVRSGCSSVVAERVPAVAILQQDAPSAQVVDGAVWLSMFAQAVDGTRWLSMLHRWLL
jgi:hypothetical protein